MKPNLIIKGAAGRMGRRITALAVQGGKFDIIAATDAPEHIDIGKDAGLLAGIGPLNVMLESGLPSSADVMIDFSSPASAGESIEYCRRNGVALVMGTTGLDSGQVQEIKAASAGIPIVQASNMSVGMNVLFSIVGSVAAALGEEYDIEIVEAHHRFKKDAPSGSALTLAENIAKETSRPWPDCLVHGRGGKDALRRKGTIGIHAVRGGDITGEHEVIFSTLGETVTISHSAHSRDTFAAGAIRAAEWIIAKAPGLYSMADVLGIK